MFLSLDHCGILQNILMPMMAYAFTWGAAMWSLLQPMFSPPEMELVSSLELELTSLLEMEFFYKMFCMNQNIVSSSLFNRIC